MLVSYDKIESIEMNRLELEDFGDKIKELNYGISNLFSIKIKEHIEEQQVLAKLK